MKAIIVLNNITSLIFALCYAYQIIYVLIGLFKKPAKLKAKKNHRYAVVISARDERKVIGNLIESIKAQNYPQELLQIFVIADNCTDDTAEVAKNAGATVYVRTDDNYKGKGYALGWFFETICRDYPDRPFEGYFILDADNVLDKNFVAEMNNVFDNGYKAITSFRNSKNYGENWITAGYSLWFIREGRYLNNARMQIKTSCAVSGTGFLVSDELICQNGGWKHYLLTEDIEFATDCIINGEKIGYSGDAVLYDEQPTKFKQSYYQRLRWAKGFYQIIRKYGTKLIKGVFKGSFSCYDMLMTLMPAMLLTLLTVAANLLAIPVGILKNSAFELLDVFKSLLQTLATFYVIFAIIGGITTFTEWKKIHCGNVKKVFYILTFPLFMMTYIPISVIALFCKVEWKPIEHTVSKTVEDICNDETNVK